MAQRPKPEVRRAIVKAAAVAFADNGFERAALGEIVERAGTSIGNLYKYFGNKDELFADFMPPRFTSALRRRIRAQVEALRSEPNVFALSGQHPYWRASEDLLAFTIGHREQVVFLLLRAQGTRYERFAAEIVRLLVDLALDYARATHPTFAVTRAHRRALTRIYTAFVATLGAILSAERSENALRAAVAAQTTYHLAGLRALFASARRTEVSDGADA